MRKNKLRLGKLCGLCIAAFVLPAGALDYTWYHPCMCGDRDESTNSNWDCMFGINCQCEAD